MSRLPRVSGLRIVRALEKIGFGAVRVTGSHHHLHKVGVPGIVTVPVHAGQVVPSGTLGIILRQAGISTDEFIALL